MNLLNYAKTLAAYNRWMNDRIYAACATLSDEERKRDVGAFFKSIHGTLNHIILGDRVWLGRFTGVPFSVQSLDQELYAEFAELRSQRHHVHQRAEFVRPTRHERHHGLRHVPVPAGLQRQVV